MTYHRKTFMALSALVLAVSAVYAAPTPLVLPPRIVEETPGETRTGPFFNGNLFTLILGKCDGVCTLGHCACLDPLPTPPSNDCPPSGTRTNHCDVGNVGALCRRNSQCNICSGGLVGTPGCTTNAQCNRSCIVGAVGDSCGDDDDCNVYSSILSTDFEPGDGWDLNNSICGDEFALCTAPGVPAGCTCTNTVTNVCITKNHAASQNCCPEDPNEDNGWSMSPSGRHCSYPGITNVHPSPLKSTSSQHMRFQFDPLGGNPPGCHGACNGDGACSSAQFGTACRQRFITSQPPVPQVSRSVWKKDIAFSGINGSSLDEVFGQDTRAGSITNAGDVFWRFNGALYVSDNVNDTFVFAAYWKDTIPDYAQFTIDFNPCENTVTYKYDNGKCGGCKNDGGTPGDTTDDTCDPCTVGQNCCTGGKTGASCVASADCNIVIALEYGFTPPYGDFGSAVGGVDDRPATVDQSFASTDHFDQTIDIDNYFVTNTPCTEACCDNTTGLCTDLPPGECTTKNRYPNMKCAKLGTPGYPPACAIATGSCCDTSPLAGGNDPEGVCTNGVLEADCDGPQQVWDKGGSCTDVSGVCRYAKGTCGGPGGCSNFPNAGKKCTANADCNAAGFCYPGTCTAIFPGVCKYSKGYCFSTPNKEMGRCTGAATCNPATGAGCCDPGCPTPCPGATGPCLVERQPCNDVPGGADCAFCEGCTAIPTPPTIFCTNIGQSGECPAPTAGNPKGICTAVTLSGCYDTSDCIAPNTCTTSKGGKAGSLCLTNADCSLEASACLEVPGACCETVKGTCDDDVYAGDCQGAQRIWTKGATCADTDCDPVLGACCDHDTFGGCTSTTHNGCPTDGTKNEWTKGRTCGEVTCTHIAIPTVSEWGIVVLTLLLLTGAKVYFGRRQRAAA